MHLLIAYFLSNKFDTNYQNRFMFVSKYSIARKILCRIRHSVCLYRTTCGISSLLIGCGKWVPQHVL